jgi:hypothetical protein
MDQGQEPPAAIEYASAPTHGRPRALTESPLLAAVLCLPGVICWCSLLSLIFRRMLPGRFAAMSPVRVLGGSLLLIWAFAVLTAVFSLVIYARRGVRPRWYVWLNLAVNVSGLLFTLAIVCLVVFVAASS